MRRADGAIPLFLGRCVPLRDGSGQIEGLVRIRHRHRGPEAGRAVVTAKRGRTWPRRTLLSHTGSFGVRFSPEEIRLVKGDVSPPGARRGSKPSLETVLQHTHPEDVALVRRAVEEATPERGRHGLRASSGMSTASVKHVHVTADAVRDDSETSSSWGRSRTSLLPRRRSRRSGRCATSSTRKKTSALREEVDKASMFEDIVGSSPPLRKCFRE